MKPLSNYMDPGDINLEYVSAIYKGSYPLLFTVSGLMMITGLLIFGVTVTRIVKGKSNKYALSFKIQLILSIALIVVAVCIGIWPLIVFYPDAVIKGAV